MASGCEEVKRFYDCQAILQSSYNLSIVPFRLGVILSAVPNGTPGAETPGQLKQAIQDMKISQDMGDFLSAVDELRSEMFWVGVQDVADWLNISVVEADRLLADAVQMGLCVGADGGRSNRFFNLTQKGVESL